jgi:hypothetical protein
MRTATRLPIKLLLQAATLLCPSPMLHSQTLPTAPPKVSVPFVGCKADGQVGALDAPKGTSKLISIPTEAAQKLAYYKAEQGPGVLAPRGWYCFETYGSSGGNLFISPQPIDSKMVFSDKWQGFTGPAIQITVRIGDTSGRFEVARRVAQIFPAYIKFTRKVIAEGIEPAKDFPRGPYPHDKLTYKNKGTVVYRTPANTEGLGTDSMLKANGSPIDGVETLTFYDEPTSNISALIFLAVRLLPDQTSLIPDIIQQVEQEAIEDK